MEQLEGKVAVITGQRVLAAVCAERFTHPLTAPRLASTVRLRASRFDVDWLEPRGAATWSR